MYMDSQGVESRERIINATIALLQEEKDEGKITTRRIASMASVGVGLINYHFQTKEKLITLAVKNFIDRTIEESQKSHSSLSLDPLTRLKQSVKFTAQFLAANPTVSRISIMNDLSNPGHEDNSFHVAEGYLRMLREVASDKNEQDLKVEVIRIISALQVIFLRASVLKDFMGLDFYDDSQRDEIIDKLLDTLVQRQ